MMCWKSAPPSPAFSSATASRVEASALAATRIPHAFGGRFARATTVSSAHEALRSRRGTEALLLYLRYAATGAPARQILGKYLPEKGECPPRPIRQNLASFPARLQPDRRESFGKRAREKRMPAVESLHQATTPVKRR